MIVAEKPSLEELQHFGVKGMRWGHRKKQDAPKHEFNTSPETRAKRDAKAAKYEKRSEDLQKRIDNGKRVITRLENEKARGNVGTKVLNTITISNLRQDQQILVKQKISMDKHAEAAREGRLTPTQKKLLIGGAVVGALIVGGVVASQVNSGQFRQNVNRGKEILTGKKFEFKKEPLWAKNLDADGIHKLLVPGINEGYPTAIGSGMNCRRCTFAYEMRRRGYDVAATRTPTASGQNAIGLFNILDTESKDISQRRGMKLLTDLAVPKSAAEKAMVKIAESHGSVTKIDAPSDIFSVLSKQPNRSRGELGVFWSGGGGHSMAYEIINGVPHIFDGQTGAKYSSMAEVAEKLPEIGAAGFTRLDNIKLDTGFAQRWVKNVKS